MISKVAFRSFGLAACISFAFGVSAQDTLQLTLPKAEEIFLKNNLSLIAAQYNINANEALIQQAKAWDNPILNTEQNLYDGKFFRHAKGTTAIPQDGGEVYLNLQQVIRTAGKRGLQVQLAQDATKSAGSQFGELMRNLHYVLITDLNNLSLLQATQSLLETEIGHMQKLSAGMSEMLKVGDISLKDDVRIKSLLYSLQSDYADNLRQQQDIAKDLRTLLGLKNGEAVQASVPMYDAASVKGITLSTLLDSAVTRSDIAFAQAQLALQQHNLSYQKALAVPDVTVGLDYDKANSYVSNYVGLQLNLPIPLFNKNRGNIAAAKWGVQGANLAVQQSKNVVQNEVLSAYNKVQTLLNVQRSAGSWSADYERLLKSMIESYEQRKVGLIEFIDFFSSYKDTKLKQLGQQAALLNSFAELNYVTGKNLIPLK